MSNKLSRRQFLKALGAASAGLLTTGLFGKTLPRVIAQALNEHLYLPLVSRGGTIPSPDRTSTPTYTVTPTATDTTMPGPSPTPTITRTPGVGSRVVHVHDPDATSWTGSTDYWNYVDQNAVNTMVDQGLMNLTGASFVASAWHALLPNYQPGQGIAIKVNFNNTQTCANLDAKIDAIIEPVNSIIRGLKTIGVVESDVWVYDAIRSIPDKFVNGCQYSGVQFYGDCRNQPGWGSNDPHALVDFYPPSGVPQPDRLIRIPDVLINASYLINIPIMKPHGYTGTTLALKNHFGSIDHPRDLHQYLHDGTYYTADYSPLVDLYRNPHILNKTILTLGDGIYSCSISNLHPPQLWSTFDNNVPESLFFSTDPVAIDCVMTDFIYAENSKIPDPSYLPLAGAAGLGIFERGDPWGSGYNQIDYMRTNIR